MQEILNTLEVREENGVEIESSETDTQEEKTMSDFLNKGCGCKWKCHTTLDIHAIRERRTTCAELSKTELDMVLLGQLAASETGTHAQRARSTFHFQGKRICRATFLLLHGIGEKRFKNIKKHFSEKGLSPRGHGNQGRVPHNAITLDDARLAVKFLYEYAEMHAILLPGRIPGYRRTDLQVGINIIITQGLPYKTMYTHNQCIRFPHT